MTDGDAGHPALELHSVRFAYPKSARLFDGFDLSIREGTFVALIGPNGSGKSTLLKLMTGLARPESGIVTVFGARTRDLSRRAIARQVAHLPQDERFSIPYTVREVVLTGRFARQGLMPFDSAEDLAVADRALDAVSARDLGDRLLPEISGGERQRVLLARALAQEPRILLLDEPASSLDLRHQVAAYDLLARLNREQRLTIVVVSHDVNLPAPYADRVVALRGGAVAADGPPGEVLRKEILERVFETALVELRADGISHPFIAPRPHDPRSSP